MGYWAYADDPAGTSRIWMEGDDPAYKSFLSRMQATGKARQLTQDTLATDLSAQRLALNPFQSSDAYIGGGFGKSPTVKAGTWVVPFDVYDRLSPQTSGGGLLNDGIGGFLKDTASFATQPGFTIPAVAAGVGGLTAGGIIPAGEGLVTQGAANSAGGGMWDWLDNFTGDLPLDPNAGSSDLSWIDKMSGGGGYTLAADGGPVTTEAINAAANGMSGGGGGGFLSGITTQDILKNAPSLFSGLKGLFGNASGGSSLAPTQGGGILGSIISNPLDAAFSTTPFLLALNEANRQSGDINNVLNQINGDAYRKSVLDPYDLETGIGRTSLLNDQELRGVRGSSFGDQSIGNFNYMRDIGRGDLAAKAGITSAALQGNLINARNTNRNLLLGAGLNASGRLFSPQPDPFGLRALGLIQ